MTRKTIAERADDSVRWTGIPDLVVRMGDGRQPRRHLRWLPIATLTAATGGFALMLARHDWYWIGYTALMLGFAVGNMLPIFGPVKPWCMVAHVDERDRKVRRDACFFAFAAISAAAVSGLYVLVGFTLLGRWDVERLWRAMNRARLLPDDALVERADAPRELGHATERGRLGRVRLWPDQPPRARPAASAAATTAAAWNAGSDTPPPALGPPRSGTSPISATDGPGVRGGRAPMRSAMPPAAREPSPMIDGSGSIARSLSRASRPMKAANAIAPPPAASAPTPRSPAVGIVKPQTGSASASATVAVAAPYQSGESARCRARRGHSTTHHERRQRDRHDHAEDRTPAGLIDQPPAEHRSDRAAGRVCRRPRPDCSAGLRPPPASSNVLPDTGGATTWKGSLG